MKEARTGLDPRRGPRRRAGALESEILATLWTRDEPMTPGDVHAALGSALAYNTVLTILLRLQKKGLVEREKSGRAHAYRPTVELAQVAAERMRAALEYDSDHAAVLQRFVRALSHEDERALRAVLRKRG